MGTSLGANTALEVASHAPERLRGMVIEMPVLDNALLGAAVAFTPLLLALTFGAPADAAGVAARPAAAEPRRAVADRHPASTGWRQDPGPSAAVIQGLFFGRTAPHREERRTFEMPALVIGHRHDMIHPFSDAGMLADELPNGRLLMANSIVELRLAPDRLTDEIAAFLDECWKPRGRPRGAARGAAPSAPSRTGARRPSARRASRPPAGRRRPPRRPRSRDVAVQHVDRDLLERGLHGGHLREDVDAVGVLVDHPLEAAHLPFDPAEAVVNGASVCLHAPIIPQRGTAVLLHFAAVSSRAGGKAAPPRGAGGERARPPGRRRAPQAHPDRARRGRRRGRDRRRRAADQRHARRRRQLRGRGQRAERRTSRSPSRRSAS